MSAPAKEEIAARVTQIYTGHILNRKCPKAHSLTRPANPVSVSAINPYEGFGDVGHTIKELMSL
jgi:hypothetical protein